MPGYDAVLREVARLRETARRTSARAVNAVLTATYGQLGRRLAEFEMGGDLWRNPRAPPGRRLDGPLRSRVRPEQLVPDAVVPSGLPGDRPGVVWTVVRSRPGDDCPDGVWTSRDPDGRRSADPVVPPPLVALCPPTGNVRIAAQPGMSLYTIGVFAISKLDWIKQ